MNNQFPLPLLWARGTTLPSEAIGDHISALDEPKVESEYPIAQVVVKGNAVEVEGNVSCFLSVIVACIYGGRSTN